MAASHRLARIVPAAALILLQACATAGLGDPQTVVAVEAEAPPAGWRNLLAADDARRLDALPEIWAGALSDARDAGFSRRIEAEGALLDPQGSLPRAMPSPGYYRCRIVRLGSAGRARPYRSSGSFFCYVGAEGELLSFTKRTGSLRSGGYLWENGLDRMVFLGAVAVEDEAMPPAYGEDPSRDAVGILDRVGPFRYRLTLPRSLDPALLDVIELVPALAVE